MMEDKLTKEIDVYPATVVDIINDEMVVINRGSIHGIKIGQEFMIYSLSDEIIKDPSDGQALGYLEFPKGTGEVINVQEKMSTIKTNMEEEKSRLIYRDPFGGFREEIKVAYKKMPFDDPEIGDKAKPV